MRKPFWVVLVLVVLTSAAAVAQQPVIVLHDPWLNWDFINNTGQMANDFHLIVESPEWTPPEVFYSVYPQFNVLHGDNNGDGVPDTMLTWADAAIMPGMATHVGAYMLGSGRVLDAYWTLNGVKLASSLPITYELTEILDPDPAVPNDSQIHMLLQFAPGYYADPLNAGTVIGWDNIRTYAHIPADMLGLGDLTRDLNLETLEVFKVDARVGGPGGALIEGPVWWESDFPAESFFDVYFDVPVPEGTLGPGFESLLVADIIDGSGAVIGTFWNLNPQCPEPGTYALIAAGLGALVLRFRRKK